MEILNSMFGYAEQMPSDIQSTLQGMATIGTPANTKAKKFPQVKARARAIIAA